MGLYYLSCSISIKGSSHPMSLIKPKNEMCAKNKCTGIILYMFGSPQFFAEDGQGWNYQLQIFTKGFFSWISMSWHQSGIAVSKHAGWWKSQGGRSCGPSKGGCWCKAVAGWSILCYWRPAVLPASSLLLRMHTRWLPPVCARFSLIPVMLAGLGCGHRQDFVDCSLFALAGFGAENMNACPP